MNNAKIKVQIKVKWKKMTRLLPLGTTNVKIKAIINKLIDKCTTLVQCLPNLTDNVRHREEITIPLP